MRIVLLFCLLMVSQLATAHELAPSLLRLVEQADHSFQVKWKTPIKVRGNNLPPKPILPNHCKPLAAAEHGQEGTARIMTWPMRCEKPLAGSILQVKGMAGSGTATLVKVDWLDGNRIQQLLNVNKDALVVPERQSWQQVAGEYTVLGVEHIWLGIDHLLFVLALLLLVSNSRRLLWTITSFTVGHSITLSLVSLGYIDFPISLVEFTIALSILVLAIELSSSRDPAQLSDRWIPSHSWLVAIGFGLLHGMGFAAVLSEIGLPAGDIPMALLTFNVGIEIGQIIFVVSCLVLMASAMRWLPSMTRQARWGCIYVIGSLSAFWCIERGLSVFS
ncbi:HupE/UreJ family protein [Photobacterium sagamiensis]|uniref:HupE/UreJ family protein n=1 Tax=Photobacterium sagamiensis TaxID=2910241 RepID=UPI003D0BCA08